MALTSGAAVSRRGGASAAGKPAAERSRRAKGFHASMVPVGVTADGACVPAGREPTEFELVRAVESLTRDQLRPYGRLLRKRLAEHADQEGVPAGHAPDVDVAQLRKLCARCSQLRVEPEGEADWSAVLADGPNNFVDIYSAEDKYSDEFWAQAAAYFEGLGANEMNFPGGRYVCAQGLLSRKLPFLEGCSLGEVCHIVQVAMAQRKLLGYLNGAIVPWARSQTMVKHQCAEQQRLCRKARMPLATWETLRGCLRDMLDGARGSGTEGLPLSNVKRVLRSRYRIDLSETALGHATVCELFRDERLKDICSVRLLDNGYFVFPEQRALEDAKTGGGTEAITADGADEAAKENCPKIAGRKDSKQQRMQRRTGDQENAQQADAAALREYRDGISLPLNYNYTGGEYAAVPDYYACHGQNYMVPVAQQRLPEAGARRPAAPVQRPSPMGTIFSTTPIQSANAGAAQFYGYGDVHQYNYMEHHEYGLAAWGHVNDEFAMHSGFLNSDLYAYSCEVPHASMYTDATIKDLRRPSDDSTCTDSDTTAEYGRDHCRTGSEGAFAQFRKASASSISGAGSDTHPENQVFRRPSSTSASGSGSDAGAPEVHIEAIGDASARPVSQPAPSPFMFGLGFHNFLVNATSRKVEAGERGRPDTHETATCGELLAASSGLQYATGISATDAFAATPSPGCDNKGSFAQLLQAAVQEEEKDEETAQGLLRKHVAAIEAGSGIGYFDNMSECGSCSEASPRLPTAVSSPCKRPWAVDRFFEDMFNGSDSEDDLVSAGGEESPTTRIAVRNTFIDVRNTSAALRLARSAPPRGRHCRGN